MDIKLYYNKSPNNQIGKSLSEEHIYTGTLRDSAEIIKPQVLIESSSVLNYNYAYIPAFSRYYFIKKITTYRTGLWLVDMEIDVLETYKNDIKELNCIIEATQRKGVNKYLSDSESWVSTVKAKTDIINFSNGLNDNGEYILITAGG